MKFAFSDYLKTTINWLYPPSCAGCGKEGEVFCKECESSIIRIKMPTCRFCGTSLREPGVCKRCKDGDFAYAEMACYAVYAGALRSGIHAMKYENNFWLGDLFAKLLIPFIQEKKWKIDVVMPVPLSEERKAERNYNQAALLAKPLSKYFGWNYDEHSLIRIKENHSQVSLTREERFSNVKDAFAAETCLINPRHVLLVDDVFTTGATANEASKALKAAGFDSVCVLTLGKASLLLS
ncbi:MAG: ComF family protein [Anaerolineaceae bacterium]|nr:ComF family protein [Anaerolineaceae bacterium]